MNGINTKKKALIADQNLKKTAVETSENLMMIAKNASKNLRKNARSEAERLKNIARITSENLKKTTGISPQKLIESARSEAEKLIESARSEAEKLIESAVISSETLIESALIADQNLKKTAVETSENLIVEELRKTNERLEKQNKLQTEFINIAAHELRSPIQPILSYLELIEKKLIDKDSALPIITAEAKRLQKLTNNILDVSRIESGTFSINFAKVRINELIRSILSSIRLTLKEDVSLLVDLDQSNNITIDADETRLSQVLSNLLGNAIKFTDKGTIQIKTNISDDKSQLDITISDTGGGIPQEIIPRLFEKFASKSVKETTQHGTGLGLFISKSIVEEHGGKISGYNNDTGGATFVVSIPIKNQM